MTLLSASGLKAADSNGKSDPYIKLKLNRREEQSRTERKTLDPTYNQDFTWMAKKGTVLAKPLQVQVFDHDALSFDDKLGGLDVDLRPLLDPLDEKETTVVSLNFDTEGSVRLKLSWSWFKPIEVFVRIESAAGLVAADKGGTSDPYAKLKLDGHEYKTKTLHKTIDPIWDQEFAWRGKQSVMLEKPLHIKIFDDDVLSRDDKLGEAEIELNSLVEQVQEGEQTRQTVSLDTQGTVTLSLYWIWCDAATRTLSPPSSACSHNLR